MRQLGDVERQIDGNFKRRLCGVVRDRYPDQLAYTDSRLGQELFALLAELNHQRAPGIALHFGLARSILDLGLLGFTVLSCPDVEQALDVVYRYHALTSDAYQVHLRRHHDRVEVIARAKPIWQRHATVIAEEFITGLWVFLGELLPSSAAREHVSIQLAYSEPTYPFRYRDLMPCHVEFGSNATSLSFPLEWGALPVETADATVAAVCREQCDELLDVEGAVTGIVGDVKRVILSVPSNRPPRLSEVAEQMMMSPRTLERELQQAGHSFRRIDNEVRMGLAAQYVALGSISGRQISSMLGYSEPAAFYRAFKQWHGKTPREYREA